MKSFATSPRRREERPLFLQPRMMRDQSVVVYARARANETEFARPHPRRRGGTSSEVVPPTSPPYEGSLLASLIFSSSAESARLFRIALIRVRPLSPLPFPPTRGTPLARPPTIPTLGAQSRNQLESVNILGCEGGIAPPGRVGGRRARRRCPGVSVSAPGRECVVDLISGRYVLETCERNHEQPRAETTTRRGGEKAGGDIGVFEGRITHSYTRVRA